MQRLRLHNIKHQQGSIKMMTSQRHKFTTIQGLLRPPLSAGGPTHSFNWNKNANLISK